MRTQLFSNTTSASVSGASDSVPSNVGDTSRSLLGKRRLTSAIIPQEPCTQRYAMASGHDGSGKAVPALIREYQEAIDLIMFRSEIKKKIQNFEPSLAAAANKENAIRVIQAVTRIIIEEAVKSFNSETEVLIAFRNLKNTNISKETISDDIKVHFSNDYKKYFGALNSAPPKIHLLQQLEQILSENIIRQEILKA